MAFIKGKSAVIEFETSTPGTYTAIYCCKDVSIEINASLLKVTDTVNGKFEAFAGQSISGTMKTTSLARIDTVDSGPYGVEQTLNILLSFTKVRVRFFMQDMTGNDKYVTAYGFIQNISLNATVFSLVDQSVNIQLSGEISIS